MISMEMTTNPIGPPMRVPSLCSMLGGTYVQGWGAPTYSVDSWSVRRTDDIDGGPPSWVARGYVGTHSRPDWN